MHLLWLSHLVPYPPTSGVQQRSYHLLCEAARRHEIDLVALNQRSKLPTPDELRAAISHLEAVCRRVEVFAPPADRSRLHRLAAAAAAYFDSAPHAAHWLRSRALRDHIRQQVTSNHYDLIHIDTVGLAEYAEGLRHVPLVLNHHNIESWMSVRRAGQESSWLRRLYFRRDAEKLARWEQTWCFRVEMNLVVSYLDRDRLIASVGDASAAVVPNGVDLHFFRPRRSATGTIGSLVFVGGLDWYPNRDAMRFFIRQIWPVLVADDPDRRMTIVGRDPPPDIAQAAQKDDRIALPGFVSDVRPYLDAAMVYVCPIRDGGGTRLKILTALAMKKPVVATAFAVEGLGLTEGQHYLRAETPLEYARQIRLLEGDPNLRRRLSDAGHQFVAARYAWNVVGEQLHEAYRSAVSEAGYRLAPGHPTATAHPIGRVASAGETEEPVLHRRGSR